MFFPLFGIFMKSTRDSDAASEGVASTRVLLVDDHALVRDGMRLRMALQPGLEVIGEADDGESALSWFRSHEAAQLPDLVITDISLCRMGGTALTRVLRENYPHIPVLVVSMHDDLEYVRQAIRAGARGYVLKDAPSDELLAAIRTVLTGRLFLSERIARSMAAGAMDPLSSLTPRERVIFDGIGQGLANKEIAAQIGVSVRTVESHRLNLKRKLGIEGRTRLIQYAVHQTGLSGKVGP